MPAFYFYSGIAIEDRICFGELNSPHPQKDVFLELSN